MLLNKMNDALGAIQATKEARNRKQSVDNFARHLITLNGATVGLTAALDSIGALKATGVYTDPILTENAKTSILESLNVCGKLVHEGGLTGVEARQLDSEQKLLGERVSNIWKTASVKYAQGPAGYLSMLGKLTANPTEARELLVTIEDLRNKSVSKSNINKLQKNVEQATAITETFRLQPNIELFLKKVQAGNASVVDLTPNIIAWLQENHLMGRLKIKF